MHVCKTGQHSLAAEIYDLRSWVFRRRAFADCSNPITFDSHPRIRHRRRTRAVDKPSALKCPCGRSLLLHTRLSPEKQKAGDADLK